MRVHEIYICMQNSIYILYIHGFYQTIVLNNDENILWYWNDKKCIQIDGEGFLKKDKSSYFFHNPFVNGLLDSHH